MSGPLWDIGDILGGILYGVLFVGLLYATARVVGWLLDRSDRDDS